MHEFDPNGAIREYRMERQRRDNCRTILGAIGIFCAMVFIVCGGFVIASLFHQ